jgi:putative ABC transport system permease protein
MLTKNLAFILRRFSRQKLNTLLHVVGLTIGITTCLLIGLFIRHELSFDGYHAKANRTYRVNQVWVDFGKKEFDYSTPFPLANQIRKDIAGIEQVTKVHHPNRAVIEINPDKRFKEEHVMMTDPEFFDVFDAEVVKGNVHEAMRKPYQAVITESLAKKYYGNEDPMGKVFLFKDKFNITVAGVIKDFPGNTHLPASLILSFADDEKYLGTSITKYGFTTGGSTFIVLPEGAQPSKTLVAGLQGIYNRTINKELGKDSHCELELQALTDIHFNAKYSDGGYWVQHINNKWLWFFGSVGLAVLLLACINFINLSTAQSLTRAKEVGVRKSIGAGKFQLINQFLQEALLLVFVSAVLGVAIAKLALPFVNQLSAKQISFDILNSPGLMAALLIGIVLTALLSGLYPAWLVSKFQPATTLKSGTVHTGPQSSLLKKGLVITQFSISVCLLIAVLLIGKQMELFRNKNLGFDKENTVILPVPENDKIGLLSSELARLPQVKDFTFSTSVPGSGQNWGTLMSTVGRDDPNRKDVSLMLADERYCSMYGFKLLAGRFYVAADSNTASQSVPEGQRFAKVVVNEKLVQVMQFGTNEQAIGKKFWFGMNGWTADIVGVVADFNTNSLHEAIKPTLIVQSAPEYDKVNIKIKAGASIPETMASLSTQWKNIFPKGIYKFNFLDEQLNNLYKSEYRLYNLFRLFSMLAMLISCLGLWGLVSFAAEQRVKEIGIRKVLGASVPNLVTLLTKDFIVPVILAIIIASPLTWWGISKWLQEFEYRIHIGWSVFALAGGVVLLIALITVSFRAMKAAIANPIKSLRAE